MWIPGAGTGITGGARTGTGTTGAAGSGAAGSSAAGIGFSALGAAIGAGKLIFGRGADASIGRAAGAGWAGTMRLWLGLGCRATVVRMPIASAISSATTALIPTTANPLPISRPGSARGWTLVESGELRPFYQDSRGIGVVVRQTRCRRGGRRRRARRQASRRDRPKH